MKSCWVIIFLSWLIIFLLLAIDAWLFGPEILALITHPKPRQVINEIDPNWEAFVNVMLPQVNMMLEQGRELSFQNYWLKRSLDKCLKKLETERGLKPIPLKPLVEWLPYEPNRVSEEISKPNEPFFVPYKVIVVKPIEVHDVIKNIGLLKCEMGLDIGAIAGSISFTNRDIENLGERLKRLDANQPSQKPSE